MQREVSEKNLQRSQGNCKPWHGAKNQYSSINFLGGFIEGISIVNFLWAISTLLFLVAGKASRVPVDPWITSETVQNVQNANRRCTFHATMSTERGNYRLITVHAPFLAQYRAKPKIAIVVWKPWVTDQRWKIQGDVLNGILPKNSQPTRVTHCAFIAL